MLTSVRSLMAATVLAGAALTATPAMAQDDLGVSVSGNVAMVTDYRFRGLGLSHGDVAVQGGIDLSTEPGVYVGTWASSIDSGLGLGEVELDIYGGWSGDVTEGVGVDVGAIYYIYPSDGGGFPSDVIEFYGSVSPAIGPATVTLGAAYAPSQDSLDFGGSRDNFYIYSDLEVGIPDTPITLTGHVGYTDGSLTTTADEKAFDWSIGGSVTVLGGLSFGVAYIGVESDGPDISGATDDTVVGTLGFSF